MRNVLVTGGAGFIGVNFVRYLLDKEPAVRAVVLDVLTYAGNRESLDGLDPERFTFVLGDIGDKAGVYDLMMRHRIDTVVNFAAESHVDRSILGPEAFIETNVVGTFRLLEAAKEAWGRKREPGDPEVRFHHVSTDEVYGSLGPDDPPFTERTPYDPSSPYSASKAASDHLVRAYHRTYGLPVTISNSSNNYGPYQHPEKLVPTVILSALEGKRIPVYGDGKQRRDWLYVLDHCDGIMAVLKWGKPGETYNIGGDNERENIGIIREICNLLDERCGILDGRFRETLIEHVPDRPGHDRRYAVSFKKLFNEASWLPAHGFSEGLKKTVDWYLSNRAWVDLVRKKGYEEWTRKNYAERGAK